MRRVFDFPGKLLVLVLLLAMPLQGVAETATAQLYHSDGAEEAAHVMHSHDGHDPGAQHDNHQNNDDHTGHHTGHFCGHHFTSVLPAVTLPVVTPDFRVPAPASDTLHDLFFPEQPDRPPLA